MLKKIISYFAERHLLANFIIIGFFIGAFFSWQMIGKEDMPDVTFDFIRISTSYKNASPEDVDYFITSEIEESIKGLSGIISIRSSSAASSSSISVELEDDPDERASVISNIQTAVLSVDLPDDAGTPSFREYKTSERAIIDIALINKNKEFLDKADREKLQDFADSLQSRLENLPLIREVNISGDLDKEILIQPDPVQMSFYDISVDEIINALEAGNRRTPLGVMDNGKEIKVSMISELDTIDKIRNLIIRGTFEGTIVRLGQIASVEDDFEEIGTIRKYNGREGIRLNVVKKADSSIIDSNLEVVREMEKIKSSIADSDIGFILMDDESASVRDRLTLISINGMIGFVLILLTLFIFLSFSSGLWVAAGIPFSFCFSLFFLYIAGYTINNMTLAAVIIVMGMIVDDAIVVAENVTRMRNSGVSRRQAVIDGTDYVVKPIFASIITTCVAFVPLYFFGGHFGKFVAFIPLVIILMLGGSLFEALFILPSHLSVKFPWERNDREIRKHWFEHIEKIYGRFLEVILKHRFFMYILFIALIAGAYYIGKDKMTFVMFPREEATSVRLDCYAPDGTNKFATAALAARVEDVFSPYLGKEVIAYRTDVARGRRGGATEENRFTMSVELVSADKRDKSLKQLIKEWNTEIDKLEGFKQIKILKSRFGQSSGSPVEIKIQENNNIIREKAADFVSEKLLKIEGISYSEVEKVKKDVEYHIDFNRENLNSLDVSSSAVVTTLKAALNGINVFDIRRDDKDIEVNVILPEINSDSIEKILSLTVNNKNGYSVPLYRLITYKKFEMDNTVAREDSVKTLKVYGDLKEGTDVTPLQIADILERDVFPEVQSVYPTVSLSFAGEIEDSRESGNDIFYSVTGVIIVIYIILALLFNSLYKPFIILLAIPFGAAGVVYALYFHGIILYGFFSAIGLIGLSGVVVNDAIVMIVKLERECEGRSGLTVKDIADIAKTRLRAVFLTTITTVAGLLPTAYGIAGYDSMLSDMMLVMAWGLIFGTLITLILIPMMYLTIVRIQGKTGKPPEKRYTDPGNNLKLEDKAAYDCIKEAE